MSLEIPELDFDHLFGNNNNRLPNPANDSILSTGTFEPLSPRANHNHNHNHFSLPVPVMRASVIRSSAPRRLPPVPSPRTPALKPSKIPVLDTSPVTPAGNATFTACSSPAPLSLPTSHSDAGRGLIDAAAEYVSKETGLPVSNGDELCNAVTRGNDHSVRALLKWVTREPVTLPGAYRPGPPVQRAFAALRAGKQNVLESAMAELHKDVARYVESKKERKRAAHKARLKAVEPQLSMEQRETARHRIEASLTKFKKAENEKALHKAMRWLAEQIQASAAAGYS